jgi:hypothetical protein
VGYSLPLVSVQLSVCPIAVFGLKVHGEVFVMMLTREQLLSVRGHGGMHPLLNNALFVAE